VSSRHDAERASAIGEDGLIDIDHAETRLREPHDATQQSALSVAPRRVAQ
jgi:hypothetical protein